MGKILVVDDDINVNNRYGENLLKIAQSLKMDICFVSNAEKALDILRKESEEYSIIMMDGHFSIWNLQGPEAVKLIREFTALPIVMISSSEKHNLAGIERGANDYLDKNNILFNPDLVANKIRKI